MKCLEASSPAAALEMGGRTPRLHIQAACRMYMMADADGSSREALQASLHLREVKGLTR